MSNNAQASFLSVEVQEEKQEDEEEPTVLRTHLTVYDSFQYKTYLCFFLPIFHSLCQGSGLKIIKEQTYL